MHSSKSKFNSWNFNVNLVLCLSTQFILSVKCVDKFNTNEGQRFAKNVSMRAEDYKNGNSYKRSLQNKYI